jgi:transposase
VQLTRRRHSRKFKAQIIRAVMQPHVSIAAVTLHFRLNANMLRSWVAAQEEMDTAEVARASTNVPSAEFVPLQLETSGDASGVTDILIEVRSCSVQRGHITPICSPTGIQHA